MGSVEFDHIHDKLVIHSHIITYGHAANAELTEQIRDEIETMWNEPKAMISFREREILIVFSITGEYKPVIDPEEILGNTNPRNNYFRIEKVAINNISFVDGLGSNTGYFQLDNLYKGSTTAAHEYGHTLGLDHPHDTDWRGRGVPGIMYPRGTLVDAQFQYNPEGKPGDSNNGGTMHPKYRRVLPMDIQNLKLHKLDFDNNMAVAGEFTSVWHPDYGNHYNPEQQG